MCVTFRNIELYYMSEWKYKNDWSFPWLVPNYSESILEQGLYQLHMIVDAGGTRTCISLWVAPSTAVLQKPATHLCYQLSIQYIMS